MADQATVKGSVSPTYQSGNVATNGNGPGVVGSIADFGNDVATLIELQAKLAALDLKECKTRAVVPLIVAAAAAVLMLASLPVVLLGVADLIARALNIAPGWAMLLTGLAALAVAGLVGWLSVKEITRSLEPLRRTNEELVRNLAWIRTVLVYSGRSTPRRG
jgi:uncharacterized membrane protein YqjE